MMLKGITVRLQVKEVTGTDPLNRPVYSDRYVYVDNVLVAPSTEATGQITIVDSQDLTGRREMYTLAIPKGDDHDWVDRDVELFGNTYHTVGEPLQGIEEMVPTDWHLKVRCERINGQS